MPDIYDRLFLFLRAREGENSENFWRQVRASTVSPASPFVNAIELGVSRLEPAPEGLPRRPDDPVDPRPVYDAAICARFATEEDADRALTGAIDGQAYAFAAQCHGYRVTEWPVLDRLSSVSTPDFKMVAMLAFHDDLPESAARRSWELHSKIAQRIHVGAGRYSRNWVGRIAGVDAPVIGGIVDIDFTAVSDLVHGYFVDERGRSEVMQDTAHFIRRPIRLYMREEVIRGRAPGR